MSTPSEEWKLIPAQPDKAALTGEFKFSVFETCPACQDDESDDCELCLGSWEYEREFTVPWVTIKEIYRAIVAKAPTVSAAPVASEHDTARLDFVASQRVELQPEFEGPWTAAVFGDEAKPQRLFEGRTPREAIDAAMGKPQDWTSKAARGECAWVCASCCQLFPEGMPDRCPNQAPDCTEIIQRDKAGAMKGVAS